VLDPATPPASFDAIPVGSSYSGSGATVTTDGQHTLYAGSEDAAGNKETPHSVSFKIDGTPPTLAPTVTPSPISVNETGVTASANASDAISGVVARKAAARSTPAPPAITQSPAP
jgi:hypothetical protein